MKNSSDGIGNRTRVFPACSAGWAEVLGAGGGESIPVPFSTTNPTPIWVRTRVFVARGRPVTAWGTMLAFVLLNYTVFQNTDSSLFTLSMCTVSTINGNAKQLFTLHVEEFLPSTWKAVEFDLRTSACMYSSAYGVVPDDTAVWWTPLPCD
jgi:hypothetical protein